MKRNNFLRFISILILLVLWGRGDSYAQDFTVFPREGYYSSPQKERVFSGVKWNEVTEGIDYSESVRGERIEDENFFTDGEEQKRNQRSYDSNQTGAAWAMVLKFLIIAGGLLVVAVIIARFLGPEGLGKPRSRRIDNAELEISLNNIEEKIHESDLDHFIRQALAQNNYNLAIRLYYLAIIKELSLSKAIRWKRDKTNRDYIGELSGQTYLSEFKTLTSIFERSWYGNRLLNEADFVQVKPRYEAMINIAKQQGIKTTIPTSE